MPDIFAIAAQIARRPGAYHAAPEIADRLEATRAAAVALADAMTEALTVHVYSLEDGDVVPADCSYLAAVNAMRKAVGLPPADVQVARFAMMYGRDTDQPGIEHSWHLTYEAAEKRAAVQRAGGYFAWVAEHGETA